MTPDTRMARLTVTANSWNSRPIRPPMNSNGMNTATSDALMEITVKPICRAPLKAACIGESPRSMKRWMFSITTIASSTTNPTQMVTAIRERLSILKWHKYINANVPDSASGTVTLAMNVGQNRRRNRKITITTSPIDNMSVNCTSSTEARMVWVRSITMLV